MRSDRAAVPSGAWRRAVSLEIRDGIRAHFAAALAESTSRGRLHRRNAGTERSSAMKKMTSVGIAVAFALSAGRVLAARSADDLAESGAPDSVLNREGVAAPQSSPATQEMQLRDAESGNPDSVDYLHRAIVSAPDSVTQARQLRAAEAQDPDAV
jgi:hypothetical protein